MRGGGKGLPGTEEDPDNRVLPPARAATSILTCITA